MPPTHKRPGTPPPAKQSQEDRDLAALKRRRESLQEAEEAVVGAEENTPIETFDEPTHPTDLVADRIQKDVAYRVMWERISRIKSEERFALQTLGNTTLKLHQNIDPKLADDVAHLKGEVNRLSHSASILKWILGFVVAASLGSVIVVATKIFTWGYSSGELEIRIKHLERDLERLINRPRSLDKPSPGSPFSAPFDSINSDPSNPSPDIKGASK